MGIEVFLENLEREGLVSFLLRHYAIDSRIIRVYLRMEIPDSESIVFEGIDRIQSFCKREPENDVSGILE